MEIGQKLSAGDFHVKVLVVDDHPNTANMLARAISRLGPNVEVSSATSGYEALRLVNIRGADILITDMMMPEMTGVELIEALNDQPSTTPIVSFILTAHDSTALRETAQRIHVKQVITKPVHPEWICQIILQTVAELKQPRPASSELPLEQNPAMETGYEILNVDQLLWDVANKFQPQAEVKNQLLVVGKTELGSRVRGNAMQLRQALHSLVWSAIQGTPKGSTVILSSEIESGMAKILVRGTGYGNNQHIDCETDEQDLATVKAIAEEHGGDVTAENEVGKGVCFTLSLPLVQIKNPLKLNNERKLQ